MHANIACEHLLCLFNWLTRVHLRLLTGAFFLISLTSFFVLPLSLSLSLSASQGKVELLRERESLGLRVLLLRKVF
jgi:hypothetical protein